MFGKKESCKRCGEKIDKDWEFCPHCGAILRKYTTSFDDIIQYFSREVEQEFKRLDRLFKEDFFDFPRFKIPIRGGGISITISSRSGEEPKVYVKTFGSYKGLEEKIKERMKIPVQEAEEEKYEVEERMKEVKVTEEASFEIKNEGGKKVIIVNLPDVKSMNDIIINKLTQSIEIRAFAKEKAYFNLIPIDESERIVTKEFKDGKLRIHLE